MWLSRVTAWLQLVSFYHWAAAQDQNSFSDVTGRQVWTLAYWTTSTNPQVCVPKMNPGWQVLKVISVPGSPIFGQALAVISVNEAQKMVHVHFRGSESVSTFTLNGFQYLVQVDFPVQPFEGMSVAQEFAKTFTALWQGGLRDGINSAWEEYCDFSILITGQSVGACNAQMLAVKMKKFGYWDYSKISLYSYSSPRCGHQAFALAVDASAQTRYQIRQPDYVITLPPIQCTSIDPANPQPCYWHAGYAVQYSKNIFGTWSGPTRCANGEASACLVGNVLNVANNNGFYAQTYSIFGPPTC